MTKRSRRFLVGFLAILGGALLLLAPEAWVGVMLLVLGAAVELAGIALERRT